MKSFFIIRQADTRAFSNTFQGRMKIVLVVWHQRGKKYGSMRNI